MARHLTTLHSVLRDAPPPLHRQVDHHPFLAPLVRGDVTLEHYVKRMLTLSWLYEGLEPLLGEALSRWGGGHGFMLSPRVAWRRKDLGVLGLTGTTGILPGPEEPLFPIESAAATLGVLYVAEGSTLGGRGIARELESRLGLAAAAARAAASFFRLFLAVLDEAQPHFGSTAR